ncbi:CopG family transcriptional regulator [Streptomyces violaceoruber]
MDNSTDAPKDGQRAPSKVGISFPPDVMDRIDVAAALRRMSRQDWIREAVAAALAHPPVTDTERAWGVGELPGDAYLRDVIERQVTVSPHQDEREALDAEYASLVEVGIGKPSADRVQTPYWALATATVTVVPFALGFGAFATIVLTDGTQDLSWTRLAIAALVFFAVTGASILAVRYWYGDRDTEK